MIYKQNLHTHSTFCDGKDTPREMAEEAIKRGFDSLGFSMHSYVSASKLGITPERIEAFKKEIPKLKEEFSGKLEIFMGMEYDLLSDCSPEGYDYTLAAVHYLNTDIGKRGFDISLDGTVNYINTCFGGDAMRFAKAYYEQLADAESYGKFDIIAHFDILTKNNELGKFLDTSTKEYLDLAFSAADALKGKIPFFEVNTGAVARGYRSSLYPQIEILKRLKELGFGVTISSDCHNKLFLDYYFDEAREYLIAAGFKSKVILTSGGFREVAL
ncbi:MAG: PHP domain-containing protein [Clostridia bacterium]|nr:PHP domain-containing protein [Clostridia bacterium]